MPFHDRSTRISGWPSAGDGLDVSGAQPPRSGSRRELRDWSG